LLPKTIAIRATLVTALGLAIPAAPIRAAGVPTLETGGQTLEEIVVTGQRKGLIGVANSATEGTILPEQLQMRPAYRVGELLETVPGLIVTQHSGEGKANQYFLRGFNLDHGTDLEITLDDMPVNMRTHAHGQGYADLNFFIPELASGIQYRKGTYSAEEGEFATAGAVHIGLVDTLPHDIASVSAGTLGDQRLLAAGSRPVAGGNLLAGFEFSHLDGPWTIPDNFRKGNAILRYSQGTADDGFSSISSTCSTATPTRSTITTPRACPAKPPRSTTSISTRSSPAPPGSPSSSSFSCKDTEDSALPAR